MPKNKSIVRQVHDTLNEKKRFGESKYEAQKQGTSRDGIRYYCRNDLKGVVYDKQAMRIASRALGHNRICVIAGHYLYNKEVST